MKEKESGDIKKPPSFYELAAKIITFLDETDKKASGGGVETGLKK